MAVLALALFAAWLLLVAGLRTGIQLRRTGAASAPHFRDPPGSPQWWARLLSAVGFACAVAAPLVTGGPFRLVEEPYLHRVHGTAYDRYAARTGRFLPWIGRQRLGAGSA